MRMTPGRSMGGVSSSDPLCGLGWVVWVWFGWVGSGWVGLAGGWGRLDLTWGPYGHPRQAKAGQAWREKRPPSLPGFDQPMAPEPMSNRAWVRRFRVRCGAVVGGWERGLGGGWGQGWRRRVRGVLAGEGPISRVNRPG